MSRNFSFFIDDDAGELVERYEKYLSGSAAGYFDVYEMERIVEYYLSYGRTKDSLTALELGQKLHPTSSLLDVKRAKIYLATGDINKAYRILNHLIEDSSDPEVVFLKVEALIKLERSQEAWELAKTLIHEEKDDLDWLCVDIGMLFMGESEFDFALAVLKKGADFNPQNVDLLFDLAFCQEQKALFDDAFETYQRIIRIDSFVGEAWFNLGQIYFMRNDFEKAIEAYDYALVINEKDTISLIQKAHSHFQLDHWKEALEDYLAYAETVSEKWQVWLFIAECYEKLENFARALFYYKLSYDEMPENYEALIGISICLLETEMFEEALDFINKAMKVSDEMADAWVYLAEAKVGLNKLDEALEAYQQAISIDPNQPDTLVAMANIYMDAADFQTALKYYQLAYSFDSTHEFIELFLAVANYYTGNYDDVAVYLELAVHRNFDAARMFLEMCPDAEKMLSKK